MAGRRSTALLIILIAVAVFGAGKNTLAFTQQQSGTTGVEATVPSDPPTQAASITVPSNGQTFNNSPINVAGLCPKGLLVEIFKNGVFAGSAECPNGSYSLQIDLFDGRNDLIARVYDALNQTGPDSNIITVTFNSGLQNTGPRVSLLTAFAKRGAPPGTPLSWPITLSGGKGPYAINVDWGDKTAPDLISRASTGDFTIEHTYGAAGSYKVTVKVSDANGDSAYLQVVGIGNGPIQQAANGQGGPKQVERVIVWWPFLLTIILIIVAFWSGKRHQLELIRDRLRRGERPFK
jgi:hypothetical protein